VTPHTAEVYAVLDEPNGLGDLLLRFEVEGDDPDCAMANACGALDAHSVSDPHIVVLFRGSPNSLPRWPCGFLGTYSVARWEQLRDSMGGTLDGVLTCLAAHAARAKGLPIGSPDVN
jgi:hypothetical protein